MTPSRSLSIALVTTFVTATFVACSTAPQTGLLVVVSSQLPLARIVTRVYDSKGTLASCASNDVAESSARRIPLPATLGLEPHGDAAEASTVRVIVSGYVDGDATEDECTSTRLGKAFIRAEAVTTYVPREVRELPIPLTLSCARVDCDGGKTCRFGTCVDPAVDSKKLARVSQGRVEPTTCTSLDDCRTPELLVRREACAYELPAGTTASTYANLSPFVRYAFGDGNVSGAEFLAVEEYSPSRELDTLFLEGNLCELDRRGDISSLGVVRPCPPSPDAIYCLGTVEHARQIVDGVPRPDAGPRADGGDSGPDATVNDAGDGDASQDATLPDGSGTDGASDANGPPDAGADGGTDAGPDGTTNDAGDGGRDGGEPSDAGDGDASDGGGTTESDGGSDGGTGRCKPDCCGFCTGPSNAFCISNSQTVSDGIRHAFVANAKDTFWLSTTASPILTMRIGGTRNPRPHTSVLTGSLGLAAIGDRYVAHLAEVGSALTITFFEADPDAHPGAAVAEAIYDGTSGTVLDFTSDATSLYLLTSPSPMMYRVGRMTPPGTDIAYLPVPDFGSANPPVGMAANMGRVAVWSSSTEFPDVTMNDFGATKPSTKPFFLQGGWTLQDVLVNPDGTVTGLASGTPGSPGSSVSTMGFASSSPFVDLYSSSVEMTSFRFDPRNTMQPAFVGMSTKVGAMARSSPAAPFDSFATVAGAANQLTVASDCAFWGEPSVGGGRVFQSAAVR